MNPMKGLIKGTVTLKDLSRKEKTQLLLILMSIIIFIWMIITTLTGPSEKTPTENKQTKEATLL